jgi:hypothetical protein
VVMRQRMRARSKEGERFGLKMTAAESLMIIVLKRR